jgi:hypothetical protein
VSFEQTVPRGWVHRTAIAEVLLTDCARTGERTFLIGTQWPRRHAMYIPDQRGRHDPTLLLKAVREAGILLATRHFHVPAEYGLVLNDLSCTLIDMTGFDVGASPAELVLSIELDEQQYLRGVLVAMRLNVRARRDGRVVAVASDAMSCLPPKIYARLRGPHQVATLLAHQPATRTTRDTNVSPASVGRTLDADVLIDQPVTEDGALTFNVKVDTTHPTLFDHALDHLPGMLQLEAIRQATRYAASKLDRDLAYIVEWSTAFLRYGNLDSPTQCRLRAKEKPTELEIHATIEQPEGTTAAAQLRLL